MYNTVRYLCFFPDIYRYALAQFYKVFSNIYSITTSVVVPEPKLLIAAPAPFHFQQTWGNFTEKIIVAEEFFTNCYNFNPFATVKKLLYFSRYSILSNYPSRGWSRKEIFFKKPIRMDSSHDNWLQFNLFSLTLLFMLTRYRTLRWSFPSLRTTVLFFVGVQIKIVFCIETLVPPP